MASSGGVTMKKIMLVCCCCWAVVLKSALADGAAQFLDDINQFRISLSLPKFLSNSGAACVAQEVAANYEGTSCTSSTSGTTTVSGKEPQLLLDSSLLSKCHLQIVNVKDGFIGPTCLPPGTSASNAPALAAHNITISPAYTEYLNDTKFVSAGAGVSGDHAWFVMVLATNTSEGNYQNQDLDPSENKAFPLHSLTTTTTAVIAIVASSLAALLVLV